MLLLTLLSHQQNISCWIALCIMSPSAHSGPFSQRIHFHILSGLLAFFPPKHTIWHLGYILFNCPLAFLYRIFFFLLPDDLQRSLSTPPVLWFYDSSLIISVLSLVSKSPNSKAPSCNQIFLPPENHTKNGSATLSCVIQGLFVFLVLMTSNICSSKIWLDTKFHIFYSTSILSFESSWSMRSHFSRFFFSLRL